MHRASSYASGVPLGEEAEELETVNVENLARTFSRLGWIGFWAQVAIGAIPVLLMAYAFVIGRNSTGGTRGGLAVVEYLTIASLLVLAFTTLWSYRCTRLGRRLADPLQRPSAAAVQRFAWTGVGASALGVLLSVLIMLLEIAQLFVYFLRSPQAGVPVIQTTAGGQPSWISAADIMTLLALNVSLAVELLVLAISLFLLFRSRFASARLYSDGASR